MSFEPMTPTQQEIHRNWKEVRARLMGSGELLKPKLVVSNMPEAPIKPDENEVRRELMDFTIAAVANVAGLVPIEVLEGLPTVEVCNSRNLAMGLCAQRHRLSEPHIAEYFGVHELAVKNAAKAVAVIMIEFSMSSRTALELVLPSIWPRWVEAKRVTSVADIQAAVCERWEIHKEDLNSSRRTWKVVIPRHAAMALARKLTPYSYPEIGRRFGGRDHTTVLHAVRKFESRMAMIDLPPRSPVLAWVNRLYEVLQENPFPPPNEKGCKEKFA